MRNIFKKYKVSEEAATEINMLRETAKKCNATIKGVEKMIGQKLSLADKIRLCHLGMDWLVNKLREDYISTKTSDKVKKQIEDIDFGVYELLIKNLGTLYTTLHLEFNSDGEMFVSTDRINYIKKNR